MLASCYGIPATDLHLQMPFNSLIFCIHHCLAWDGLSSLMIWIHRVLYPWLFTIELAVFPVHDQVSSYTHGSIKDVQMFDLYYVSIWNVDGGIQALNWCVLCCARLSFWMKKAAPSWNCHKPSSTRLLFKIQRLLCFVHEWHPVFQCVKYFKRQWHNREDVTCSKLGKLVLIVRIPWIISNISFL